MSSGKDDLDLILELGGKSKSEKKLPIQIKAPPRGEVATKRDIERLEDMLLNIEKRLDTIERKCGIVHVETRAH